MNLVTECDLYVVSVAATHPPTGRATPGSPPSPLGTRPRAIEQVFGRRGARACGTPETGVVAARRVRTYCLATPRRAALRFRRNRPGGERRGGWNLDRGPAQELRRPAG